jgi:hypothetical protein
MYEWRVTVNCPVRSLEAAEEFERRGRFHRRLYVWTEELSATDACAEARRVIEGWPSGTRIIGVDPVGMYVWLSSLASELPPGDRDAS